MPRSRSWSIESITRSDASCAANTPAWRSMASTSVVLPWSTWAMIATLRRSEREGTTRSSSPVASYAVNDRAVAHARKLIEGHQYVLRSEWGEVQPSAEDENDYLESHGWEEYAQWHLGLTEGAADETKARYAFVYGDFRRLHRSGLIACQYRAAEWRHKEVELAAHDLLQLLDQTSSG